MQPSEQIKAFIKARESCHLSPRLDTVASRPGAPVYDIGWGHRLTEEERPWRAITQAEADALFDIDILVRVDQLNEMLTVEIPQQVWDALFSALYNLGSKNIRESTLLAYVNAGMLEAAAISLLDYRKAAGKDVRGLVVRRALEQIIFTRGEYLIDL